MFNYSIDEKDIITDRKGNAIVDLSKGIFSSTAGTIKDYTVLKMTDFYEMRPDLVSQAMYETDAYAEFILKFAGISNPFTLSEDDVLLIPNDSQAIAMMAVNNERNDSARNSGVVAQIRNFFKFVNQEYKSDSTSYDNLAKKDIPSGVIDITKKEEYIVPYISEDGRTAVTIKNGRMYFGEDTGIMSANNVTSTAEGITKSVQSIIDQAMTDLSNTNCIYNGSTVTDFVRSNYNNNRD